MSCNKEAWKEILSKNGNALSKAPKNIRSNKDLVIQAIKKSSLSIRFASSELRDDFLVADTLIDSWLSNYHATPKSFKYLSKRIKSCKRFSKKAFKRNLGVYLYLNQEFIQDPNFYLKIFKQKNWEYLVGLNKPLRLKHPFLNLDSLTKINLTTLDFIQRLKIAKKMIDKEKDIFIQASVLDLLDLKVWSINHYSELIIWQHLAHNDKRILRECKKLGENCLFCNPLF